METFLGILIAISFMFPFLVWGWLNFLGDSAHQFSWSKWKIIGISFLISFIITIILITILVIIVI